MVESQIRTNKVTDEAVIAALLEIPRERFVPEIYAGVAYVDEELPLGDGRFLMEPMIFARLLQLAEIEPGDAVLDIGCTTGYSSAVLARLAKRVVALESNQRLAAIAEANLKRQGFSNASVVCAAMVAGAKQSGPYQVIFIGGAVAGLPPQLTAQLAEGGRLVSVIRKGSGLGQATLTRMIGGAPSHVVAFDAATPYLPGFVPEESFVF
jgi:protein-L-isoaspartate(D-aspartate) O-methyltransferase